MRRFVEALNFAALRHRAHRRKGAAGAPYINPLIEVAHILSSHGLEDEVLLAAAVLHDSIEDVGVTPDELRARFGDEVTSVVLEMTDDSTLSPADRKQVQVEQAGQMSERGQNLKVADKISNLRGILTSPPTNWTRERKLAYYSWAKAVVEQCERADERLRRTFRDLHDTGLLALDLSHRD